MTRARSVTAGIALAAVVAMPDAELRRRVAAAWQTLYGAPLLPGQRAAAQ